jgi:hypothetical protein
MDQPRTDLGRGRRDVHRPVRRRRPIRLPVRGIQNRRRADPPHEGRHRGPVRDVEPMPLHPAHPGAPTVERRRHGPTGPPRLRDHFPPEQPAAPDHQ